ncbi:MAG: sugar ABC transporter ATP-binding protein [Firmicutes bacterium]|nr:sugar ABC transporter ATP-binding protein [Bacillota bacterium]
MANDFFALEMKGIEKSFGSNYVLKKVDLTVEKGSIHALLGENGAGKSTLMNILGGVIDKDSGTITANGKIAFIHQELSLVNDLNIYENLFLGNELKKGPLLDARAMSEKTSEILKRIGVNIKPTELVSSLSPSYKQVVEIARALLKNADIIIMDEPTTSLTDVEIQRIFEVMNNLRGHGISLIFISHKLNEVIQICDSYTILRDGNVVAVGKVDENTTEQLLSAYMIGREISSDDIYRSRLVGEKILEIKDLSKEREFSNINMHLCKGEILGVTGLLGDGRTEVFAAVAGANWPYGGQIYVNGKEIKMKTTEVSRKAKVGYLPKNRKENGIIRDLNIKENVVLPIMSKISTVGVIDGHKENSVTANFVKMLSIKVSNTKNLITSLSGGNQQKVVLSKALSTDPEILILDNPTQGVDVGAKLEIYKQILDLADAGYSIVVLTNEFPELQKTCDRCYVMFQGEVRHEFTHSEMTESDIMLIATGGRLELEVADENEN